MAIDGNFDQAVAALIVHLEGGPAISREMLDIVLGGLGRLVAAWYPALSFDDRSEIASVTLSELVEEVGRGRVDQRRNPVGFVVTLCRHRAVDHIRRSARVIPLPGDEVAASDEPVGDQIDDLLSRLDGAAALAEAMQNARRADDHAFNDTVRVWLAMSERLGRKVALREVADTLRVSHTEVRNRLLRGRAYLPATDRGDAQ
jgi:DNA-directed RNA polymerase specialized sigma24 family protein